MRKYSFIGALLLLNVCYSQNKFSIGASGGFTTIEKTYGINENLFIGYNTSKNITIGIDGMINQMKVNGTTINTTAIMAYIEAGNPSKGLIKDKLYFSGIIGLGYLGQSNTADASQSTGTYHFGAKVNYKISEKVLIGIKSGYYFSKIDNIIIANFFLTYKL